MDKGPGNTPQEIITGVKSGKGFLGFVREGLRSGVRLGNGILPSGDGLGERRLNTHGQSGRDVKPRPYCFQIGRCFIERIGVMELRLAWEDRK